MKNNSRLKQLSFVLSAFLGVLSNAQAQLYIEVESKAPLGNWKLQSSKADYSGTGYFYWDGGNNYGNPSATSTITYTFTIAQAGNYHVDLRGRRDQEGVCAGAASDECNDIFTQIDNGTWYKTMMKGPWGKWHWQGSIEDHTAGVIRAEYQLTAGTHTIKLAGRSEGVIIDAFAIYKVGTSRPEASTGGGNTGANCIAALNYPGGRIAMSFDGNVHDDDDIIALPVAMSMIWAAGLKDKLVHVEYSNHVCSHGAEDDGTNDFRGDDAVHMRASANGSVTRFGLNSSVFYDYSTQGTAATTNFINAINASSVSDPLWIIAAGPMETVWRALKGAQAAKRQYVTVISHSNWNQNHGDCGSNSHTWSDMVSNFSANGVKFVQSCGFNANNPCTNSELNSSSFFPDQNNSNGDNDFNTPIDKWHWMRDSDNADLRWVFSRNPFGNKFDPSDAGMVYFLITGGPNDGGNKTAGWRETKELLENPCTSGGSTGGGTNTCAAKQLSAITDFTNLNVSGFVPAYKDNARNAIAVNSVQHSDNWSAANTTFNSTNGTYDITINTLTEIDGESTYLLRINGVLIGSYQNPRTTTDYAPSSKVWNKVTVKNGDLIQVEFKAHTNGLVPEGNVTAYSRGRWTGLSFVCFSGGNNEGLPSDISNLQVKETTCGKIVLSWGDVSNESGYRIRRKEASESAFVNIADVASNVITYTDLEANENTNYVYMVRPLQGGTAVAVSNQVSVLTKKCTITANDVQVEESAMSLYPNPVLDILHLSKEVKWELLSIQGVVLSSGYGETIDMNGLTHGTYLVQVEGEFYKVIK